MLHRHPFILGLLVFSPDFCIVGSQPQKEVRPLVGRMSSFEKRKVPLSMKIAFFSDCFYPHLSGVTSAMIAHANLLVEQGHEVVIFNQTPWKYLKTIDALDERVELQSIGLSMRVLGHNKLYLGLPTFYRKKEAEGPAL